MESMYESKMNLPLFQGLSKENISQFLEKTSINFINYSDNEKIAEKGSDVKTIRFIINGEIKFIYNFLGLGVVFETIIGEGDVMGAERLFGLSPVFPYDAVSYGASSVMEFSKEQYFSLLNSDKIYLLNYLNYLSLRAQRPLEMLMREKRNGIREKIGYIISLLSTPRSEKIMIKGSIESFSKFFAIEIRDLKEWIKERISENILNYKDNCLEIKSRSYFS